MRLLRQSPFRAVCRRVAVLLLSLALLVCGSAATAGSVAITFDDLPIYPEFPSVARGRAITQALLTGFRRHRWPVVGFVNEGQLEGRHRRHRTAVLKMWADAGFELGNHTYSHPSLTATPVDSYIEDIARGDAVTRPLDAAHGVAERWFRHPYLETGATAAARQKVDGWLADHGYRVAPVSIINSDWVFAEPYDEALRRGRAKDAAAIRTAYLAYTAAIVPWYQSAARTVLDREPAFVFLLHASQLNAACVDDLSAILDRADLHPVTLEQAVADPAYALPDHYVGKAGIGWVQRWGLALGRKLPDATEPAIPAAIQRAYDRIEAEDPDDRTVLPEKKGR